MKAKRLLVVAVTFIAGLYYLLEFVLPPSIGGAIDSGGASAACETVPGSGVYLYTASRDDRPPVIAEWSGGKKRVVISPSIFRRDDYRGAQNPQAVGQYGPYRGSRAPRTSSTYLYYIGLGYDDKTPRVCMASQHGGQWVPAPRAIVDKGQPGEWDSSGITWAHVVPNPRGEPPWLMWYVGRQGNVGRVGLATSDDGRRWTKRGMALDRPDGGSIESICLPVSWQDGLATPGGVLMTLDPDAPGLLVASRSVGQAADLMTCAWQDGESSLTLPIGSAAVPIPAGRRLADARAAEPAVPHSWDRLLVTLQDAHGVSSVHLASRESRESEEYRIAPAPLITPGPKPHSTYLSDARTTIDDLMVVIGSFAVGLGLISLIQVHGRKIVRKHRQWPESLTFFVAAGAMTFVTLWDRTHVAEGDLGKRAYTLLFYGLFQPLGSAMFSLLAAYLVSAAYRAFRVRSFESTLMAASALLIMLGQVPIGNWLTRGLPHAIQIPTLMTWILFVTNNAVVRAVNFGIFVGALATAVRVWLSMDRAAMRFD